MYLDAHVDIGVEGRKHHKIHPKNSTETVPHWHGALVVN